MNPILFQFLEGVVPWGAGLRFVLTPGRRLLLVFPLFDSLPTQNVWTRAPLLGVETVVCVSLRPLLQELRTQWKWEMSSSLTSSQLVPLGMEPSSYHPQQSQSGPQYSQDRASVFISRSWAEEGSCHIWPHSPETLPQQQVVGDRMRNADILPLPGR